MTVSQHTLSRPLGQVLVEQGLLTDEQLRQALDAQVATPGRQLLGEIVVELGFCTEMEVLQALADAYGAPFVRLTPRLIDPAVASLLKKGMIEQNAILPLFLVDNVLTVAMAEPANLFLVEDLQQSTGHEVQVVASPRCDILATAEAAFQQHPADARQIDQILSEIRESGELREMQTMQAKDQDVSPNDSPVIKLVHQLIVSAVRENASDIHFEPGDKSYRVRFRVDGRLYEKMSPPPAMSPPIVARIKILAGLDIAERRLPQDGALRIVVDDRTIDLRASTLPNKFGEKVVLRILDQQSSIVDLSALGMEPQIAEAFRAQVRKPHGIVLVTGPTGSGKTTTLYAAINAVATADVNICTAEDPVEYVLSGVNQFQVNESIGLGFPNILRSLLRQDPDVIMIGEIRDPETARIAVQAALTGHLVLSTLHTNDAPSAVTRLLNLGIEPFLIAASLESVLAQRLLRRICTQCKAEVPTPPHLRTALERVGISVDQITVGNGCMRCHQVGLKGRMGAYELLLSTDEIRTAISSESPTSELRRIAVDGGMQTLLSSGLAKAQAGETTYEEVLRVTVGAA